MGSASEGTVQRGAGAAAAPLCGEHELQPGLPGAPAAGEAVAPPSASAREAEVHRCAALRRVSSTASAAAPALISFEAQIQPVETHTLTVLVTGLELL